MCTIFFIRMAVEKGYTSLLDEIFHKAYILKSGEGAPAVVSNSDEKFDGNFAEILQLELALNEAKVSRLARIKILPSKIEFLLL